MIPGMGMNVSRNKVSKITRETSTWKGAEVRTAAISERLTGASFVDPRTMSVDSTKITPSTGEAPKTIFMSTTGLLAALPTERIIATNVSDIAPNSVTPGVFTVLPEVVMTHAHYIVLFGAFGGMMCHLEH